jgi:hypothetical protein
VFQIDNNTVLKLAWNNKGVAQNEADARVKDDYYLQGYNFLPEVYDVDENYQWVEMQIARHARKSDFKRLTGYDWDTFYYWVVYCWNKSVARRNEQRSIPDDYKVLFRTNKWLEELGNGSLFSEIEDYIGNYEVQGWGDIATMRNWGVAYNANGNEELVLVDNGLDNDVLDKYYKE